MTVEWKSGPNIYDLMQVLQKIIICGNIFLVIVFSADIFITYIALNPISTFLPQFYTEYLANFAGSTSIFFFIAALMIQWFGQIVAMPPWTWLQLLLRFFLIDSCTWWHILSSSSFPPTFLALFSTNKFMNVSVIDKFALSWEIVPRKFIKFFLRFNG